MTDRWGKNANSDRPYFLGSKITADSDCSHDIKRRLLLGINIGFKPRQHIKEET